MMWKIEKKNEEISRTLSDCAFNQKIQHFGKKSKLNESENYNLRKRKSKKDFQLSLIWSKINAKANFL